jgi:hypothetical protein
MGKNRSASGLTNVIQYDNNGNIAFVSGSTTLMQVSSSGAITTTGVISGSNALSASFSLNSALLNDTGSVGFATTASLLTVSSSQQQISASLLQVSASYISLSGSYNTFSGSNSEILTAVSSSQQQISSSLLNVISIFATTGSNSFRATQSITGSLTVTGQIIAQTLNVQQVTSSIIYSSGSNNFGCDLNSRQTFTGSFFQTGSTACFVSSVQANGFTSIGNSNSIVQQASTANSDLYFEMKNSAGTRRSYIGYGSLSSSLFEISNNENGAIDFRTNATFAMRIASTGCVGIGNTAPTYQLDMCSGTTVNQRIRLQRGSDDTNQNMLLGWNNITVTRSNVSISGNQTDFSIIQCGSDGARVPFYIGVGGVSCFGCGTLVCGNIGITSTCSKFYQLTNNCKSADSVLDIYNTAADGFGVAIQAGAINNNYALGVSNYLGTPLLHVAGNGQVGIGCSTPNAKLTINSGNCTNTVSIYGCNSSYISQLGWFDSTNLFANDGVGGQRVALIEIGTVAGTGTGCRGANMALYTHEANGSLKLPLLLMHNGNVCLTQGNLYTTCTLFAPGTPMQVVAGSTTFSSGASDTTVGLGTAAAGSTPAYNAGCVIVSVSFTPKSATSKILIQTTNIAMWETANVSDHFYLFASNDTAGNVLTKAGSYLQAFGQSNNNGAIISLNGIANSWGTSTNTISFRAASTGGGTSNYQYNPYYGSGGFNADTVGFFGYSITEIS